MIISDLRERTAFASNWTEIVIGPHMSTLEAKLFILVVESPRCAELQLSIAPAPRYGVQIILRGQVMGVWSERDGVLGFRNLASWYTRMRVATAEEALTATIEMAENGGWVR